MEIIRARILPPAAQLGNIGLAFLLHFRSLRARDSICAGGNPQPDLHWRGYILSGESKIKANYAHFVNAQLIIIYTVSRNKRRRGILSAKMGRVPPQPDLSSYPI